MKPKFKLAALALITMSSAASAFTKEQNDVIAVATVAQYAGLDDHCPRFKLNVHEMIAELSGTGLTSADFTSQAMSDERSKNFKVHALNYAADPSGFCNAAWQKLGPNGTYKRQMLESK